MFTRQEVEKTINGARVLGSGALGGQITGVSTDSRTVKKGELFIPLRGPKFDGRRFIPQALKKGAFALETTNGLTALQTLAAYHRSKFKIPIIGVTGSVGKTTTKELIAAILAQKYPVLKNEANYNNEIGVPLTLLHLTKKHRAAVIEMGMQGLGEIKLLAALTRPTIAVVTNIGESHLGKLGSRKNIARAKAEIFSFLNAGNFAVINQDDDYFERLNSKVKSKKAKVMTFGLLEKSDVMPVALTGIKLALPGEHNIYNALAAVAVARILRVGRPALKRGLETVRPAAHRLAIINLPDGTKVIDDCYNASPRSMTAALKVLSAYGGRKIAVLGDMLELGRSAKAAHRQIVKLARQQKVDKLLTFGRNWPSTTGPETSRPRLIKKLRQIIRPRDIILVKGSRGTRLEEVVTALQT
ncbi:MAG: UDP-N-acetylmuramoyl-tripeptide--D-alanyl-D-alanine ligase [Candidatus Margulisbacteria bacterium]|nr:UDP-N-acetylmuramoyl-tripeptide--D-alanyl-D-alanine ligase [Candidatus Margulisiibacteriota bacterium]